MSRKVFYSREAVLPRSLTHVICDPWAAHTIRAVDGTVRYIPSAVVVSPAVESGLAVPLIGEFEDDMFEDMSSETFPEASLRGRTVNIVEREVAAGVIGGGGGGGGDHRYLRILTIGQTSVKR
jgi:hypothetical protein